MTNFTSDPPGTVRPLSRVALRAFSEFATHVCAVLIREFEGNLDLGIIFITLLRRTHMADATPISVNALSRAAGRPFETMRRQCRQLCDRGLVFRNENGLFVPAEGLETPEVRRIRTAFHDNLVRLISDVAALDYPLPQQGDGEIDHVAIECAAYDLMLFAIEFGMPVQPYRTWLRPMLFTALMAGNARSFAFDRSLALSYADRNSPPPDDMRISVSASALARAIGIPYATVRRNVEAMLADQQIVRAPRGYLVNMAWMQTPASLDAGNAIIVQMERLLRGLGTAGFPFAAPETAYLDGEPERISFQ